MRIILLTLALIAFMGCSPKTEKERYAGQVVFIIVPDGVSEPSESSEVESDFNYLLESVSPYFEKHRIKYEVKKNKAITLTAINGKLLSVKDVKFPSVGYVLIKPTGEFVVRNGLGTDVDVITDVNVFFKISQNQESRMHNIWLQPTRINGATSVARFSMGEAASAGG